jgi:LysR family transcriptional regulator, transcriptional activator of the cysJI operon
MELRLLRTFTSVAELRHFAKAADACNLSQPAVSHQIALLEEEVGGRLFNRTGRRVTLTVAGDVLLEEARRVLGAVDRARERMQEVTSGAIGRIRLGASPTPGLYILPNMLADYRSQHPRYDLHFEIAPVRELCDRVARNDLDMAVVTGMAFAELQSKPLLEDELMAIARAPLEGVGRGGVLRKLANECWILREDGSETRRQVSAWLHRHHVAPAKTMTFEGPDAVKRAVMAGLGVSVVSRLTVRDELASGSLVDLRVASPLFRRQFCVVDHPQKHHGAACRAMLAMFERAFGPSMTSGVVNRRGRRRIGLR